MAYLLDTNVFVNAKRDWYGFDFCPGFWDRNLSIGGCRVSRRIGWMVG